jgi:HSP20 family protein
MFIVPFNTALTRDTRHLSRLLDNSFERFFGPAAEDTKAARSPALDLVESDASYTVTLDMPGVGKEDVKVAVDGKVVTVDAKHSVTDEKKDGDRIADRLIYCERSATSYSRRFSLPLEVDQADAVAKLEHGVLTLTLPKRVARSAAQITIN